MNGYSHYIRVDTNNIVIHRFSDAFEQPQAGDICVATDAGRQYNNPVRDGEGFYLYKWDGTQIVARTDDEIHPLSYWQQKKIAELLQSLNTTLLAGFTSMADGTSRTYGFSDDDAKHWDWVRGMVTAGTCPNPVMVKDINGNRLNLTPTQAGQLCTDAQNFYLTTYQHWDSKEQTVLTPGTTKDAVNAVTW